MPADVDLRSLEAPVVQAGMGAIARHELAAAVSEEIRPAAELVKALTP